MPFIGANRSKLRHLRSNTEMIKVLFICHGNICRSPMAEFIMKKLVSDAGLASQFEIASAATSTEELGNLVYPPARSMLNAHGISCAGKTARQMNRRDYEHYDWLVGMDSYNLRNMSRICSGDPQGKMLRLLDLTPEKRDVADPWYSGDFDAAWSDIDLGCRALLSYLMKESGQ